MDSGNSGSIQSSSGGGGVGDEEYDSRAADSISAFLNTTPPEPHQPSHPHPHHHHLINPNPSMFNPNSLLNFDNIWSSNPLPSDHQQAQIQSFFGGGASSSSPPAVIPFPSENNSTVQTSATTGPRGAADHGLAVRGGNPKKRSRASRRAPTTVMTTDTANFRAMVQEFTGIPPPPFTSSSSPFAIAGGSNRLDLFGTPAGIRSNPFLLRPFAHKYQPPPPPSFLSPPPPPSSTTTSNNTVSNTNSTINYPILTFPNPSNHDDNSSHLKMSGGGGGVLDELGLGHGLSNGPNLLFSLDGNGRIPTSWAGGGGGGGVGPNNHGTDQSHSHFRSVSGQYNSQSVGNLVNFSASSSDFRGEKVPENVSNRGDHQGMVEPWICSSD